MANLAAELVNALGDPNAMDALMSDRVTMRLPRSARNLAGPFEGRAAVYAFNTVTYGERYFPEVEVTILDAVGDEAVSAVRFQFKGTFRGSGKVYVGEYAFFVRGEDGLITEIFEHCDTLELAETRGLVERTGDFT